MGKQKYTADEMISAIEEAKGNMAHASRILGCNRQTVANYIERYSTVKDAYDEANESTIDYVESKLLDNINNGDTTAIIFFLKTKGKHRGYVEKTESSVNVSGALSLSEWKEKAAASRNQAADTIADFEDEE